MYHVYKSNIKKMTVVGFCSGLNKRKLFPSFSISEWNLKCPFVCLGLRFLFQWIRNFTTECKRIEQRLQKWINFVTGFHINHIPGSNLASKSWPSLCFKFYSITSMKRKYVEESAENPNNSWSGNRSFFLDRSNSLHSQITTYFIRPQISYF